MQSREEPGVPTPNTQRRVRRDKWPSGSTVSQDQSVRRRWPGLTPFWSGVAAAALIAIGAARIVSTYGIFWQITDEPATLATGIEWLDRGTYTLEPLHPPLGRVLASLGPYLDGRRSPVPETGGIYGDGNAILDQGGHYERTLALERAGVLPFFALSAFLVWLWARSISSESVAVLAVAIYTCLPIVLALGGVAVNDMAITAMLTAYLLALIRLVEAPSRGRAVLLGVCAGAALTSKFSAVLFIPACTLMVIAYYGWTHRRAIDSERALLPGLARPAAIAALAAFLTIWGVYRFSTETLGSHTHVMSVLQRTVGEGASTRILARLRVPAPEFFTGMGDVAANRTLRGPNYFLGEVSPKGRPAYYPVAILVKTPLAVLALAAAGFIAALGAMRSRPIMWQAQLPALLSATLLLCAIPTDINIGLRLLLPIFPLLALVAATGARWLVQRLHGVSGRILVGSLLVWLIVSTALVHPDYLAYFNEAAGQHPERILIGSDLDWGQDLKRLTEILRRARIDSLSLAYAGSADLPRRGVAAATLEPNHPVTGWVAISVWKRFTHDYSWLDQYTPIMTAGKSIWIYHITGHEGVH